MSRTNKERVEDAMIAHDLSRLTQKMRAQQWKNLLDDAEMRGIRSTGQTEVVGRERTQAINDCIAALEAKSRSGSEVAWVWDNGIRALRELLTAKAEKEPQLAALKAQNALMDAAEQRGREEERTKKLAAQNILKMVERNEAINDCIAALDARIPGWEGSSTRTKNECREILRKLLKDQTDSPFKA